MKGLTTYINEAKKSFTIKDGEREAFATILGFATGDLGEGEDIKQFDDFRNELSKEEIHNLDGLFDLFDDTTNYPKLTHMNIRQEEKYLITKLLNYIEDNCDNLLDEYSYELGNLEEIFL